MFTILHQARRPGATSGSTRAHREAAPAGGGHPGGIALDNAGLVAAGADLLAVISDVFSAPDPAARAAATPGCSLTSQEAPSMTSRNERLLPAPSSAFRRRRNSPVRAFRSVGGTPPSLKKALGARVWDADGKEYLDYVGSWGGDPRPR